MDGALTVPAAPISAIADGTSNTIMFIEDVGRQHGSQLYQTLSKYVDPECQSAAVSVTGGSMDTADCGMANVYAKNGTTGGYVVSRWADPDAAGSGISGPSDAGSGTNGSGWASTLTANPANGQYFAHYINNSATPMGGPANANENSDPWVGAACPWQTNNCGLNDEPFSFHPAGCNSVFADGSVHFLGEKISPTAMRAWSRVRKALWSRATSSPSNLEIESPGLG